MTSLVKQPCHVQKITFYIIPPNPLGLTFFVCANFTDTVDPSSAFTSFNLKKNSGNKHIYNMKMFHNPKLGTSFTCRFSGTFRRMLLDPKRPLWDWGTWKLAISHFFSSWMGSENKSPPPMPWSNVNTKVCLNFFVPCRIRLILEFHMKLKLCFTWSPICSTGPMQLFL